MTGGECQWLNPAEYNNNLLCALTYKFLYTISITNNTAAPLQNVHSSCAFSVFSSQEMDFPIETAILPQI